MISSGTHGVLLVLAGLLGWVVPVLAGGAVVYLAVRRGVRDGMSDAAELAASTVPPTPPLPPAPSVPPTPSVTEA